MSAIEELNTLLLSLSALKPPGANKSKITAITNLCIANANVGRDCSLDTRDADPTNLWPM